MIRRLFKKDGFSFRLLAVFLSINFLYFSVFYYAVGSREKSYANIVNLPLNKPLPFVKPYLTNKIVDLPVMRGLEYTPENPLNMSFFIDTMNKAKTSKKDVNRLIKYFLGFLAVSEDKLWVNLSPYEKDRMLPDALSQLDIGKDLLLEDYILKQFTSALTDPKTAHGKKFWKKVYEASYKIAKTTKVPVNTFNKIWIVPEKAVIVEYIPEGKKKLTAFIKEARLKVLLEEDYHAHAQIPLRLRSGQANNKHQNIIKSQYSNSKQITNDKQITNSNDKNSNPVGYRPACTSNKTIQKINTECKEIFRRDLLPIIEKQVNESVSFAPLRQLYYALILATYFKKKLKAHSIYKNYFNQEKNGPISLDNPEIKNVVFDSYVETFKKGIYNYVKKEYDPYMKKKVTRRYYSGGMNLVDMEKIIETEKTDDIGFLSKIFKGIKEKVRILLGYGQKEVDSRESIVDRPDGEVRSEEEAVGAQDFVTSGDEIPATNNEQRAAMVVDRPEEAPYERLERERKEAFLEIFRMKELGDLQAQKIGEGGEGSIHRLIYSQSKQGYGGAEFLVKMFKGRQGKEAWNIERKVGQYVRDRHFPTVFKSLSLKDYLKKEKGYNDYNAARIESLLGEGEKVYLMWMSTGEGEVDSRQSMLRGYSAQVVDRPEGEGGHLGDVLPTLDMVVEQKTPEELFVIFRNIVNAVKVLHYKGVVHNDLKPKNILVREDNNVLIFDYGAAAVVASDKLSAREKKLRNEIFGSDDWIKEEYGNFEAGTNGYLSPGYINENIRMSDGYLDEKIEAQLNADIYSLGVILVEMLILKGKQLFPLWLLQDGPIFLNFRFPEKNDYRQLRAILQYDGALLTDGDKFKKLIYDMLFRTHDFIGDGGYTAGIDGITKALEELEGFFQQEEKQNERDAVLAALNEDIRRDILLDFTRSDIIGAQKKKIGRRGAAAAKLVITDEEIKKNKGQKNLIGFYEKVIQEARIQGFEVSNYGIITANIVEYSDVIYKEYGLDARPMNFLYKDEARVYVVVPESRGDYREKDIEHEILEQLIYKMIIAGKINIDGIEVTREGKSIVVNKEEMPGRDFSDYAQQAAHSIASNIEKKEKIAEIDSSEGIENIEISAEDIAELRALKNIELEELTKETETERTAHHAFLSAYNNYVEDNSQEAKEFGFEELDVERVKKYEEAFRQEAQSQVDVNRAFLEELRSEKTDDIGVFPKFFKGIKEKVRILWEYIEKRVRVIQKKEGEDNGESYVERAKREKKEALQEIFRMEGLGALDVREIAEGGQGTIYRLIYSQSKKGYGGAEFLVKMFIGEEGKKVWERERMIGQYVRDRHFPTVFKALSLEDYLRKEKGYNDDKIEWIESRFSFFSDLGGYKKVYLMWMSTGEKEVHSPQSIVDRPEGEGGHIGDVLPTLDMVVEQKTPEELFVIFSNIVNAVKVLHSKGVVHNDLKPKNILVREDNNVLILDYGAAAVVASDKLSAREKKLRNEIFGSDEEIKEEYGNFGGGTPGYMFPGYIDYIKDNFEEFFHNSDRKVEAQLNADIYSLGTVLVEMLILKGEKLFPWRLVKWPPLWNNIYLPKEETYEKLLEILRYDEALLTDADKFKKLITDMLFRTHNFTGDGRYTKGIDGIAKALKELEGFFQQEEKQNERDAVLAALNEDIRRDILLDFTRGSDIIGAQKKKIGRRKAAAAKIVITDEEIKKNKGQKNLIGFYEKVIQEARIEGFEVSNYGIITANIVEYSDVIYKEYGLDARPMNFLYKGRGYVAVPEGRGDSREKDIEHEMLEQLIYKMIIAGKINIDGIEVTREGKSIVVNKEEMPDRDFSDYAQQAAHSIASNIEKKEKIDEIDLSEGIEKIEISAEDIAELSAMKAIGLEELTKETEPERTAHHAFLSAYNNYVKDNSQEAKALELKELDVERVKKYEETVRKKAQDSLGGIDFDPSKMELEVKADDTIGVAFDIEVPSAAPPIKNVETFDGFNYRFIQRERSRDLGKLI